jgi:D-threonate/D-erythronate kinase
VVVPDVRSDADLATLAALATRADAREWLWCGSAGLGWALARQHAPAPPAANPTSAHRAPVVSPPVLLVTASQHPVLRGQLQHLAQHAGSHTLIDLMERDALSPAEAAERLASRALALVATRARPGTLVVVGGDTLLALCRASGVRALRAGVGPRAGWGSARFVGGRWDGTLCLARSGAFGAADDLHALLQPPIPSTESTP